MIGALAAGEDHRALAAKGFADALRTFAPGRPVLVLSHFDADGLSAAAILVRALAGVGRTALPLIVGKGETPWASVMAARLAASDPGGLILADLGTRPEPVIPGCPTLVIDHHVPTGVPQGAVTISGNGLSPEPTTALLAWWAARALGDQGDLLWLSAIGLIGDVADEGGFPELLEAQARWGKTALRDAVLLINAPRRTAAADAGPALRLLLKANGPKEITKGQDLDALALHAAKAEVRAAMDAAKRVAPLVVGDIALIRLDSACQVHPLIAQQWRGRLDMYRMSSDIAPYATHPDMPQFHGMVVESDADLRSFGAKARAYDIRLSFHPSQYVLLNAPNPELTRKSIWDLSSQAEMLDRMEQDDEAVLITHVGGVYDDHDASRARWIEGWERCPAHVKRRLVLENDDIRFSAADVLWIHERTGVRCVFDYQHFWCLNPERLDMRHTLERFVSTWPSGVRPEIHFSSPRTELREVKQKITPQQRASAMAGTARRRKGELLKAPVKATARIKTVLRPPIWTGHADFTNPFEFATFMRMAEGLTFDVMMEGKSKDLSLLRLRPDLLRPMSPRDSASPTRMPSPSPPTRRGWTGA